MQYQSIILIEQGNVTLTNVNFKNIMTSSQGAVISNTREPGDTSLLESFTYNGGTVTLINNGYEFATGTVLGNFMSISNVIQVTIANVVFSYNIFNQQTSNFVTLASFYQLILANCTFEYNLVLYIMISLDQTNLAMTVDSDATYQKATNLYMYNNTFKQNTANYLVDMVVKSECQNINLTNNTFDTNYVHSYLVYIEYELNMDSSCITGGNEAVPGSTQSVYVGPRHINITNSNFTGNFAMNLVYVVGFANALMSDLIVNMNGYSFDPNLFTFAAIKANPDSYLSLYFTMPVVTSCVVLLSYTTITNFAFTSNSFHENSCPLLSLSSIKGSLTTTNSLFWDNTNSLNSAFISISSETAVCISGLGFWNNTFSNQEVGILSLSQQSVIAFTISDSYFYNCSEAINTQTISSLSLSNINVFDSKSSQFALLSFSGTGASSLSISNVNVTTSACASIGLTSTGGSSSINLQVTQSYFSWINTPQGIVFTYPSAIMATSSVISDTSFVNNTAAAVMLQSGGGVLEISNSIFSDCSSVSGIVAKVSGSTDLLISSSTIENNSGTNLLYVVSETNSSIVTTSSCVFKNNSATLVKVSFGVYTDLSSTFQNNTSTSNSLIFITDSSTVTLKASSFLNNTVEGDGLIMLTVTSTMYVISSSFSFNSASVRGGVLFSDQNSVFVISNSRFISNTAAQGSAIYSQHCSSPGLIVGSTFQYNEAWSSGCITTLESLVSIDSTVMSNNLAPTNPCIEIIYYSGLVVNNSVISLHSGIAAHISVNGMSTATVTNSAFSDSKSLSRFSIFNIRDSTFTCKNCTFSNAVTYGYSAIGCDNS